MQVQIQITGKKITNKVFHRRPVFKNHLRTQFCFGLAFKHRLLHPYRNSRTYTSSYIRRIIIFFIKITDGFYIRFTKSSEVCTTLRGKLTVYKRIIFFAILIFVSEGHFNIFSLQMNDGVTYFIRIGFTLQQIKQTIFTYITFAVIINNQPRIKVTVIPELVIEILVYIMKILKYTFIRGECYQRTIIFPALCFLMFFN